MVEAGEGARSRTTTVFAQTFKLSARRTAEDRKALNDAFAGLLDLDKSRSIVTRSRIFRVGTP